MKLGSHQVSCGKWHLKSLILAIIILTVFLCYIHMSDEHPGNSFKEERLAEWLQRANPSTNTNPFSRPVAMGPLPRPPRCSPMSGVRAQKRDLVVRPAKPYKSPLSRRRHPKPHKDDKGIHPPANVSFTLNKPGADIKHNKSKVTAAQQLINANRGALNKAPQFRDKYAKMHKDKLHPSSPSFSQVTPVKNLHLDPFKASDVKGDKKLVPYIFPGGGKILSNIKTSQQTGYNVHASKVGAVLQTTKTSSVLSYQKNNNGSFLKPLVPNQMHADAKNQPANSVHDKNVLFPRPAVIPRPIIKMRRSLP